MQIQLNRRYRLIKTPQVDEWILERLDANHGWLPEDKITDTRRGVLNYLQNKEIPLSREAEHQIDALPETQRGFREGSGVKRDRL